MILRIKCLLVLLFLPYNAYSLGELVQSNWVDLATNVGTGTLAGSTDEYWLMTSDSQNQHIGRDGTLRGAIVRLASVPSITGVYIAALRQVTGTTYTVVGKSEETTTGLSAGLHTLSFSQPIRNVRSSDLLALGYKVSDGGLVLRYKLAAGGGFPILDTSTAKVRWHDSNSASYSAVATGSNIVLGSGGAVFGVIDMVPLMDPPVVAMVGDSISEGSPLNRSYRTNATAKNSAAAFGGVLFRDQIGTSVEIAGNVETSNNANNVLGLDLSASFWAKKPKVVYVHVGVNDIYEGRTWATYKSDLDAILLACSAHGALMVFDDIFPWTGNPTNTTGTHDHNTTRDTWNANKKAWAKTNSVKYVEARFSIGTARITAKGSDPAPTSPNAWNIVSAYDAADGLGVHLSEAGCSAVASKLSKQFSSVSFPHTSFKDLYMITTNSVGKYWNGTSFEAYNSSNWATYAWPMVEISSGLYSCLFPPLASNVGSYSVQIYLRSSLVPATSNTLLGKRVVTLRASRGITISMPITD